HPSATLSRPALLHRRAAEKRVPSRKERRRAAPQRSSPLLVEEGLARSDGVVGLESPQDHPPRHCRVLPSSARRARSTQHAPLLVARRGGAQRRGGGVRSAAGPPVRDTV